MTRDKTFRQLQEGDIAQIVQRFSFPWRPPEINKTVWDSYYKEQQQGLRTVVVVEIDSDIVGYGSLRYTSQYPRFADANIPEIHDLWIDRDHRNHGLGQALVVWIEKLAQDKGYPTLGIGVGLYKDYGPAQRLYCKMGYLPDGNGIAYHGQSVVPG